MLVISGNGTSRAAWHEKLGFQKKPYICAFSSLLPDGGLVPFIDVIVTKLYPLGYKGAYVEGESPDLWDEEEERARQRKWEVSLGLPWRDGQFSCGTLMPLLARRATARMRWPTFDLDSRQPTEDWPNFNALLLVFCAYLRTRTIPSKRRTLASTTFQMSMTSWRKNQKKRRLSFEGFPKRFWEIWRTS